jgi:oligopeptide/dipeptide ABC transporter ATP-binding protein
VTAAPLLAAHDLRKTFAVARGARVHALNGVSIAVERGECVAVIGESGSGKSTLGRILLGLVQPDSGSVRYAAPGRIQAVFQEPYESLNPRHRVHAIVREPLDINRRELSRAERESRAREGLRRVGLADEFHHRLPRELSGGQQQRVGIARALILEPAMLILDEPTSSLDVSVRAQILDLLAGMKRERGISMLYISHDIGSVERIADRICVMYRGQIMETGRTADVLAAPRHPYSRALLSARLVPDPNVRTQPMRLAGEIPSQTSIPPFCLFAGRCPDEMPDCRAGPIPMIRTEGDRESRCIRARGDAADMAASPRPDHLNRDEETQRSWQ